MRITFDPAAQADLADIFEWISKDNKAAAYQMISRIRARIALLATPDSSTWGVRALMRGRAS
jgi:plasmid stabilization system protein ParE